MKTQRSIWQASRQRLLTAAAKIAVIPYYRRKLSRFFSLLDQTPEVQRSVLFDKLRRCTDTVFGRDHRFSQIKTIADFRRQVPIFNYDALAPYIAAVSHGDQQALFPSSERVFAFACTTGTTGEPKLNPVTRTWLREYLRSWEVWGLKAILDHSATIGAKVLQLTGPGNLGTAPNGLNISMVSALASSYQNRFYRSFYAIPPDISDITDPEARYYLILRLCLPEAVGLIISITPSNLLRLAEVGERHQESLIKDLRDGSLSRDFDVPDRFRRLLAGRLRIRHRERAGRLERLATTTGRFRPCDYWPLCLLACWLGGTVGYQSCHLSSRYGSTPARDLGLVSTEGRHTIPFQDGRPEGVLAIDGSYYEFVPYEHAGAPHLDVLEAHQLTPGHEYRLIMTTSSGLYRYDIGDVVRCQGFVGQAPLLEFLHKTDQCADLEGEKISGYQLAHAVKTASAELGVKANWFLGVPIRRPGQLPYYAIVLETRLLRSPELERRFLRIVDGSLISQNVMYSGKRNDRYLDAPQIVRLRAGTWERYQAAEIQRRGNGDSQYKPPTLVLESTLDQLLRMNRSELSAAETALDHAARDEKVVDISVSV